MKSIPTSALDIIPVTEQGWRISMLMPMTIYSGGKALIRRRLFIDEWEGICNTSYHSNTQVNILYLERIIRKWWKMWSYLECGVEPHLYTQALRNYSREIWWRMWELVRDRSTVKINLRWCSCSIWLSCDLSHAFVKRFIELLGLLNWIVVWAEIQSKKYMLNIIINFIFLLLSICNIGLVLSICNIGLELNLSKNL